ncbi:MAG: MBL fold metallo-hydrolase, partial [Acidobacteriota bacterium]|nr:MBL fold metallo-hydrolase [Acidobacteriota bacterium]
IKGNTPVDRALFSGGNVGVFVMDQGVAVVDTKLPGWGPTLFDRIRNVTDKPVVTIINTHTHGDHTGSNEFFPDSVNIVAHENTKANMERMDNFQGENAKYLPKQTYTDRVTLGSGDDQIDLYYFGAGHTSGDTFIVYPALGVLQTGDMFPWRDAPFLDVSNGGSGLALPTSLAAAINTIDGVDTVIPGHIPVTTWASFQEFQRFTADLLDAVRSAKSAGLSADQVVEGIDLSAGYPAYNSTRVEAAVRVIYDELP